MPVEGQIFAVPMKQGGFCFAVVCPGLDWTFFKWRSLDDQPPSDLLLREAAFRVFVAKDAPRLGNWRHVGQVQLTGQLADYGRYAHRPVGAEQVFAMKNGETSVISLEEAMTLELAATWFSSQIEERLEDSLAGRENSYVMAMRRQHGLLQGRH